MGQVQEILEQERRIGAGLIERCEKAECRGRLSPHQQIEQIEDLAAIGEAHHVADLLLADLAFGQRQRAVQK